MSEYEPCKFMKGGYAESFCESMSRTLDTEKTKRHRGVFQQDIVEHPSFKKLGVRIVIKSGEFAKDGIVINVCPFCGEKVRDTLGNEP